MDKCGGWNRVTDAGQALALREEQGRGSFGPSEVSSESEVPSEKVLLLG